MMLDQTRQLRCCTQLRPDFWPFPRDLWLGVTNWALHRVHPYHVLSRRQLVSRLQPATRRRVPTSYSPLSAMGGSGSKPTGGIQAQQTISAAVRCVAVVYWRCAHALCAGGPWIVLAAAHGAPIVVIQDAALAQQAAAAKAAAAAATSAATTPAPAAPVTQDGPSEFEKVSEPR